MRNSQQSPIKSIIMITLAANTNTTAATSTSGMCCTPKAGPAFKDISQRRKSLLHLGYPVRDGKKHSPKVVSELGSSSVSEFFRRGSWEE